MAPKNKAEVVESKTPAEFFSEHQSICGFDNVSRWERERCCHRDDKSVRTLFSSGLHEDLSLEERKFPNVRMAQQPEVEAVVQFCCSGDRK